MCLVPAAPEQGREFTLQCLSPPFPAPPAWAVKPVWAHSPLSPSRERNLCLARGDLPWVCVIRKGIPVSTEEEMRSRNQGRGRGRVPGAESWGPAWASPRSSRSGSGVSQQLGLHLHIFCGVRTLGEGMGSEKLTLPQDAALHLFEKVQFYISPLFYCSDFIWNEAFPLVLVESVGRLFCGVSFSYSFFC